MQGVACGSKITTQQQGQACMLKLATLVYVKRPGQTLMLHRIKRAGDMHQGKWNGLGGKFEPGESPEACAIREVYEESGLTIRRPELRGILTFPNFRAGEDWYAFVFVARTFHGELIDSSEGVLQWIDDADLLELPLWEGDRLFLPWLEQERFFSGRFVYENGRLRHHEVIFYPQENTPQTQPLPPQPPSLAAADADEETCWLCGGAVIKHNCKITCTICGFRRDCSDP